MSWAHVSHCFPLNGNVASPEINGVDEVLAHYRSNLNLIKFMGPTHFAEVLETARKTVEAEPSKKMFYILLILTDGDIHDMKETI